MSAVKEKISNVPVVEGEGAPAKRRHAAAGQGKENWCDDPSGPKKPKLAPEKPPRVHTSPAISQLQERIEMEHKIRDGATKLLQARHNATQSMEASKGIFVSNAKIIALMREIQQLQADTGVKSKTDNKTLTACPAKLAISDIRIPLEWQEYESIHGKVDTHALFGVFCLFRIGNQVMDTPSLVQLDRSSTDIDFSDTIIFPSKVEKDFSLEVEVYCSLPPEESATHHTHRPSTPIRMFKKFRGNKEDTPGSSQPTSSSSYPNFSSSVPPYRFALAGHAHLTINDITSSRSTGTCVLKQGAVGSSGTASTSAHKDPLLPLWGQICCKLMAQPDCATESRKTGFINVQRMVSGLPDWMRLWCVMRQNRMRCWKNPEDVGRKMPEQIIEISENMTVEPASRLVIRRPNTLLLRDSASELFMAFESKEEQQVWVDTLHQALLDLSVWKSHCEFIIPLPNSKFYMDSPSTHLRVVPKPAAVKKKGGGPSHTRL